MSRSSATTADTKAGAKKRFGQNFLQDRHVVARILEAVRPQPGDRLVEIGPGRGALTSGLGYAIWYTVLPALRATSAATLQLSVPVITALGGVMLLSEPLSLRLVLASIAVLGGVAMVVLRPVPRG